jgi:hypothetical protein
MKGKLLSYEEIIKLPHGTKVWEESDCFEGICLVNQENKYLSEDEDKLDSCGWTFSHISDAKSVEEFGIKIYEWFNEDEQPITTNKPEKQTYKGSELIQMIESGLLKDNDIIVDKNFNIFAIENVKDGTISCGFLFDYAPFTIKRKGYLTIIV